MAPGDGCALERHYFTCEHGPFLLCMGLFSIFLFWPRRAPPKGDAMPGPGYQIVSAGTPHPALRADLSPQAGRGGMNSGGAFDNAYCVTVCTTLLTARPPVTGTLASLSMASS
jgi:hypothetical protein